jgi:hypothetical protein
MLTGSLTPGAARLTVEWRQGPVEIGPSPDDQLSWSAESDQIEVLDEPGHVTLKSEVRRSIRLTVRVPATLTAVKVDLGHGNLTVTELPGTIPLDLNIGLGDAHLGPVHGPVKANLGKGDFHGDGLTAGLNVNLGLGELKVSDVRGPFKANSGAGSAHITDAVIDDGRLNLGAGSAHLTRVGGVLHANSGVGSLEVVEPDRLSLDANCGLGGLTLRGGRLTRLHAELGRGNLHAERTWFGSADVVLKSGNAVVRLPGYQTGRVEAEAQRGRVVTGLNRIQVPFPGGRRPGERVVLTLDPGPEEIHIEARRGNITIDQDPVTAPPRTPAERPPAPPTADDDPRRPILEAVERGELTPEEAVRLLDQLGQGPG